MRSRPVRRRCAALVLLMLLAGLAGLARAAPSLLFIGNSFTFGGGSGVQHYRPQGVTDLNGEGQGGVPALVKVMLLQAGLDHEVALETRGGSNLDWHFEARRDRLARRAWDRVVMQGYSTLDAQRPGDPSRLIDGATRLADWLRRANPAVEVHLIATWSRADLSYPEGKPWSGRPIDAMARDLRRAYDQAAASARARSVIPVGEAWNRAFAAGIADANPYDGIDLGRLNLWAADHYHASAHGSYLTALVVFGALTGRDPRSLGGRECAGFELGFSPADVRALQQVAFEQLAASKALASPQQQPVSDDRALRCAALR